MTFQFLYTCCQDILDGFLTFASNALNWFTTPLRFGTLGSVTPIVILSTGFFTFLVARIVLNFIE